MIRPISILIVLLTLFSCKRECKVVKETYKNGKKLLVRIYPDCNERNDYKMQTFYESGQISSEGYVRDGLKNGNFKSWYDNGQQSADWEMKKGKEHGFIQCWYKNGQKKKEVRLKNGLTNGLQKSWYENSKPEQEGSFINGKRQGLWKTWLDSGEYTERNYVNDTLNGVTVEILPDKRKVFGQYKNGKEVGQWIWKDSLGNLEQTAYYKDGVYDSVAIQYYPDGRKRQEGTYKNGKLVTTKKY